jgi:hypothetical protein
VSGRAVDEFPRESRYLIGRRRVLQETLKYLLRFVAGRVRLVERLQGKDACSPSPAGHRLTGTG